MYTSKEKVEQAKKIFRKHRGIMRTSEALKHCIHPRILYFMRDHNYLDVLARGTYRLTDLEPVHSQPLALKGS